VLVSNISSLSRHTISLKIKLLIRLLHVLIVCCIALVDLNSTRVKHSLGDSHDLHLISDSPLILHLFILFLLLLGILLPLFFMDLLLKRLLHGHLLHLSFVLDDVLLISPLGKNVAISLKLEVHSVFENSSSGLDVWKILLRY
jgi:hypothetical protein